jgi:hypothetical protein
MYVEVCLTKWHLLIPLRVIHFLLNIVPSEVMISWCCVLGKTVLDFIEVLSNHLLKLKHRVIYDVFVRTIIFLRSIKENLYYN